MLTGYPPMRWQARLFKKFATGELPSAISIPTGLGKTAVMAIWLIALAHQMQAGKPVLPRRLVYIVDRRAVVDQATQFAETLRENLCKPELKELARSLFGYEDGPVEEMAKLPISTLRGQFIDNREWLADPAKLAIIVGTVDMIGSRLLFEGYGVSRKMRPYHAGLLGVDTLMLLDEAHLVPPFEALLAEIADNAARYGPKSASLRALMPKFQFLPLSATGRRQTAHPFTLEEQDVRHPDEPVAVERLFARKRLIWKDIGDKKLQDALAESAWEVSGEGKKPVRVIVYCDSRDVAKAVKNELDNKSKETPAQGRAELFVGARRVRERSKVADRLIELGFLAGGEADKEPPAATTFLIATSAGEVGVDLDADHMVCDLVAWERMVQRLGRVNRRGGKDRQAEIIVHVDIKSKSEKVDEIRKRIQEQRNPVGRSNQAALQRAESALKRIQEQRKPFGEALQAREDESFDVSPEALRQLNERIQKDEKLAQIIADASSPVPLRPALNRALVDAWAMTSLLEHTGRPEIEPWLRGWVDKSPQTVVAWRKYFPLRPGTVGKKEIQEIEDFFEAAPIHVSETLETETWRIKEWLQKRIKQTETGDVIGVVLDADGGLVKVLYRQDIPTGTIQKETEKFQSLLLGKTLVVDVRFGGLHDGLLSDDTSEKVRTADDNDDSEPWIRTKANDPVIRFRVIERDADKGEPTDEDDWKESLRFNLECNEDGEAERWLSVQKWRDTSNTENDRAEGRPQSLSEHQSCAAARAAIIGKRLKLSEQHIKMLTVAARLHDEGKKAERWQFAFRAVDDQKKFNIEGPLAKTRGPIIQSVLDGYRHEFGSLTYARNDAEFMDFPEELQNLVLHLIAAHHGYARPLIGTSGCDGPRSMLNERAYEVALRFARLQRLWGPWGLAWWEALLRAADAQASRENDARGHG
jgi:CRISPR-associated endonuclease/helicase Cas3